MKNKLYLINGPLGAGKTTLLKYLVDQEAFRSIRVIENEFASVSIDSEELHDHVSKIETIAGLCICCSTGTELVDALNTLKETPEPVIIEATGVANSLKLIEKLAANNILDSYNIAKAFFVIDAAEVHRNPSMLAQHDSELKAADLIVITKTDLLSDQQKEAVIHTVSEISKSDIAIAHMGQFDPKHLEGDSHILDYFVNSDEVFVNHDEDTNYTIIDTDNFAISEQALKTLWENLLVQYGLKRLKGTFRDETGQRWHVEATPSQYIAHKQESDDPCHLVFIGEQARLITQKVLLRAL